jgi:hypothetical protein
MPKKPDDQYGYDDRRHTARTSLYRLEQQADSRPDKPARQLGDVLKLPKITPKTKRLIDTHADILDGPATDRMFSHSVLCQTSLPLKPTDKRVWERSQGNVSLRIEAGAARHPVTGEWVKLGLPYGEKARVILLHLNGEAMRTGSPIIEVERSLTAFVRDELDIDPNGRNLRFIRDQLACLAAARIALGIGSKTVKTDVINAFDLWSPGDAKQRTLWPSTVQLDLRYFETLVKHAVPLDKRAIVALAHSALALDVYAWLAQRLHRIPEGEEQLVSWQALKTQFGPDYDRLRKFREKFLVALKAVHTVYPTAKIEKDNTGLLLRCSQPPVPKKQIVMPRLNPLTIDATATEITGSDPVNG